MLTLVKVRGVRKLVYLGGESLILVAIFFIIVVYFYGCSLILVVYALEEMDEAT